MAELATARALLLEVAGDNPFPCQRTKNAAPFDGCDCWACEWVRRARKFLGGAR